MESNLSDHMLLATHKGIRMLCASLEHMHKLHIRPDGTYPERALRPIELSMINSTSESLSRLLQIHRTVEQAKIV